MTRLLGEELPWWLDGVSAAELNQAWRNFRARHHVIAGLFVTVFDVAISATLAFYFALLVFCAALLGYVASAALIPADSSAGQWLRTGAQGWDGDAGVAAASNATGNASSSSSNASSAAPVPAPAAGGISGVTVVFGDVSKQLNSTGADFTDPVYQTLWWSAMVLWGFWGVLIGGHVFLMFFASAPADKRSLFVWEQRDKFDEERSACNLAVSNLKTESGHVLRTVSGVLDGEESLERENRSLSGDHRKIRFHTAASVAHTGEHPASYLPPSAASKDSADSGWRRRSGSSMRNLHSGTVHPLPAAAQPEHPAGLSGSPWVRRESGGGSCQAGSSRPGSPAAPTSPSRVRFE